MIQRDDPFVFRYYLYGGLAWPPRPPHLIFADPGPSVSEPAPDERIPLDEADHP